MLTVDKYTYKVGPNEQIEMRMSPFEVSANFVAVALDGKVLVPSREAQLIYTVNAAWQPNTIHVCQIEASFPGNTAADAKFDVLIKGSYGGEGGFSIRKSDPIHDPELTFYCSDESLRGHAEIEPPEPWPRPKRRT